MPKRDDFDDFFGDDEDTSVVDTRADGRLYRVPLGRLAPNLVNPRQDFGTEDELIDFGKSLARRQNQPCPVVSRTAYLKLWPDHTDRIGDIDYVLVSGERRYRGATAVGLPALDCVVNDGFAADRKTFMEAVVSENVDRQNFDPVEEAYAVQALVAEFGSNRAVAQHFERVDGWVTQRILLTHLHPQMQDLVRSKSMPLEAARSLGKRARDEAWSIDQQAAWWSDWQDQKASAAQARKAVKEAAKTKAQPLPPAPPIETPPPPQEATETTARPENGEPSFTAVKQPEGQEGKPPPVGIPEQTDEPQAEPAKQNAGPPETSSRNLPEQRPEEPLESVPEGRKLPYDDGMFVAQHLIRKMPTGELVKMLRLLNQHATREGLEVAASVDA